MTVNTELVFPGPSRCRHSLYLRGHRETQGNPATSHRDTGNLSCSVRPKLLRIQEKSRTIEGPSERRHEVGLTELEEFRGRSGYCPAGEAAERRGHPLMDTGGVKKTGLDTSAL